MLFTGNELDLTQKATKLAMAWHRQQKNTAFKDMDKLDAINKKLNKLLADNRASIEATGGECYFTCEIARTVTED